MKKIYTLKQIILVVSFLFFQTFVMAQRDVYLVIGQSNAAGRGAIEAEDMVTLTGVDLYNGTSWESAVNTAATDGGLNRYSTIQNPAQDQGLNFSYTFGRMLNEVTGDQIGLVVNARGGTSIDSWAKGHVDDYYGEAITEITAALALGGSTLKGVLWHQGESDRNDASYIAKLTTLINDLRTDLGIADLPVIVGQLSMQRTDNETFNTNIEALVVADTDYAATDGLQTTDLTHFNSNAQRVLGYRYAAKVLKMVYGYTYVENEIMYVTEDTYIRGGTSSAIAQQDSEPNIVRVKESNANTTRRGLFKFDVSALTGTADRLVVDATLMLNADNGVDNGAMDISFYDIYLDWTESTVVYDDVEEYYTTAISASTTTFDEDRADADGDGDSEELIHGGADLTEFIKKQYDFGNSSISLGLKSETTGNYTFKPVTKEGNFALRPYIIASYIELPASPPPTQTTKIAKLTFETDPTDTDPAITDLSYTVGGPSTPIARVEDRTSSVRYFKRTDGTDINSNYIYSKDVDLGDYYFAAQDIDMGDTYNVVAELNLEQIDISGYENLEIKVYLAENHTTPSRGWDNSIHNEITNDYVHFDYDIDETTVFSPALWIESIGPIGVEPDEDNRDPAIDTDFDGVGDSTILTNTFTQYSAAITGTGDLLDITIEFSFNGQDEDIGIDNIEIWGTLINDTCSGTDITWNGTAWSGTPDITTPVVIDGDYSALDDGGSFSACSLTVNSGATLTIEDGYYVEIEHDTTIDGDLTVENNGAFVQNVDTGTYTNSGSGETKFIKSTDPLTNWYDYTYWSSPMSGLTIGTSPLAISSRSFWHNATNYLDEYEEIGNTGAFVVAAAGVNTDDIDDNGDDWQWTNSNTPMTPGIGFTASHTSSGFTSGTAYDYEFVGEFNNGEINVPIVYNAANTGGHWNLIGNPYPCALDFDAFVTNNPGVVDGLAYLWSQQGGIHTAATSGNQDSNFSNADYMMINTGSGSVNNNPSTPLEYIPSCQSFFIAGISNANVTFNNSMRIKNAGSNTLFFKNSNLKSKKNSEANKLWVNLTTDIGGFNQVLIAYVDGATDNYDGLSFDAPRQLTDVPAIIYTRIADKENKKFAIQGKNVNSINEEEVIPLSFSTIIESTTIYSLSIGHLQGDFLTTNTVYLKDNLQNKVHNLSESDYSFTSETGEYENRFEIVFNSSLLSSEDNDLANKLLKIISLENNLTTFKIATNDLSIKEVTIYDLLGRNLSSFKGKSNTETFALNRLKHATYIARVKLSDNTTLFKKFLVK